MTTNSSFDAPSTRYVRAARLAHWLTAILVLTTIPAGLVMVQEGISRPLQDTLFLYHKNIGPVILILVVLRIVLRAMNPPPPLPDSVPRGQAIIAETVHWLLYLCLIVMAVSGFVRVQAGGFPMEIWDPLTGGLIDRNDTLEDAAKAVHYVVHFAIILLVCAHVGAAALHGLVKKDGVFSRMWPPA
ncbi:cytochrome b [Rhodobacterales bacterium HKCCE2091]|nr:cytochrome b [Rhodobacterales bacterium HKCCE2091]